MAMAITALLSPQLPRPSAPPLRAHHPPSSPLLLPRRRAATSTTTLSAAATSLSSARGDPHQAEAAVAELLLDHSASSADAAHAPGYAAMLAEGVRELELWRPGVLGRGPPRAHPQG